MPRGGQPANLKAVQFKMQRAPWKSPCHLLACRSNSCGGAALDCGNHGAAGDGVKTAGDRAGARVGAGAAVYAGGDTPCGHTASFLPAKGLSRSLSVSRLSSSSF
jgi:hypothetical protein